MLLHVYQTEDGRKWYHKTPHWPDTKQEVEYLGAGYFDDGNLQRPFNPESPPNAINCSDRFIIVNKNTGMAPDPKLHKTFEAALDEAKRLSLKNLDTEFQIFGVVFSSFPITKIKTETITTIDKIED